MGIPPYTASFQRAVGSGAPSVVCRTAWGNGQCDCFSTPLHSKGQWAVRLLQHTAAAQGYRAMGLLQYIATLQGGAQRAILR